MSVVFAWHVFSAGTAWIRTYDVHSIGTVLHDGSVCLIVYTVRLID